MKKILVYLCCAVFLLALSACDRGTAEKEKASPRPASISDTGKMPHFALPSAVDGTLVDSDEYDGRVRLINFFATWCPPCIEEVPTLIKLDNKYNERGFSVIGLSVDQGEREVVKKFVEKMKIHYSVLIADDAISDAFGGVSGIPVSYLVAGDGTMIRKYFGYVEQKVMEQDIEEVLNL
jgi:thiol-disulfide isomerase/thioredoxin